MRNDENDESIKRLYFGKFNLITGDFDVFSEITTLFFNTSPISIVLFENKIIISFDYYITIIDNDTLEIQQWIYRPINIYPANAVISLKISDGFLYVIGNNKWIELLELSEISSEIFLLFHLKMAINDMYFSENKIYLLYDNGIERGISSMLKTEFYSQSFSYKIELEQYYDELSLVDDLLYATGRDFYILNLSNSIKPLPISKLDLEGYLAAPYILNKIAFIPFSSENLDSGGLYIINVTNSENPELISTLYTKDCTWDCEVINDYAYLASHHSGLAIANVSDIYHPQVISYCNVANGGWARDLAVLDNYTYVGSGTGGLSIIDISNKSNPKVITSLYGGNIGEVEVIGDYAYFSSYNDIRIANISNPVNSNLIRTVKLGTWDDIINFQKMGNLIYIITENSYDIVLNNIDISNPANPQILNSAAFAHDWMGSLSQFAIYMDYIMFSYDGHLYKIYNNCSSHYNIQKYFPILL